MRFSGIFQRPPTSQRPAPEKAARAKVPGDAAESRASESRELPEDLDARVRLVGEWQLGEG